MIGPNESGEGISFQKRLKLHFNRNHGVAGQAGTGSHEQQATDATTMQTDANSHGSRLSRAKRSWLRFRRLMAWDGWVARVDAEPAVPARWTFLRQSLAFLFWGWAFFWGVLSVAGRWGFWSAWLFLWTVPMRCWK